MTLHPLAPPEKYPLPHPVQCSPSYALARLRISAAAARGHGDWNPGRGVWASCDPLPLSPTVNINSLIRRDLAERLPHSRSSSGGEYGGGRRRNCQNQSEAHIGNSQNTLYHWRTAPEYKGPEKPLLTNSNQANLRLFALTGQLEAGGAWPRVDDGKHLVEGLCDFLDLSS